MAYEMYSTTYRPVAEALGIDHRFQGLRATFVGRTVLVVGGLADSPAMQRLLRLAGARLLSTKDLDVALHLVRRFPIDVIVADTPKDGDDFDGLENAIRDCRTGADPMFVRLPPR
jgi:hypothetical protein